MVSIVVGLKMYEEKLNVIFKVIVLWDGIEVDVYDLVKNVILKIVFCDVKKVVIFDIYVKCVLDYVK